MIKFLKCFVLFILLAILSFALLENIITNITMLVAGSALTAILLVFMLRNHIYKLALNESILIFSFLIIIIIPLIGKKEKASLEKRELADFPSMRIDNVWAFFFDFTDYFSDRFAYRNVSVSLISKFKYIVFAFSPVPNIVTLGKDNWLFNTKPPTIMDTCDPLTEQQLKQIKMNLHITTKWFDQRNIKYYFTIIPYKSRVYPEMMPDQLRLRMRHANYIQLLNYLENDTTIRIIDCTQELIKGKKIRPVYYKTDTHWNEYGAFLGYRKIIERVRQDFPQIIPLEISDFKIDSSTMSSGDLQFMLGFTNVITTPAYSLKLKRPITPIISDTGKINNLTGSYSRGSMPQSVNRLKLFMIRDSFTEHLKLYFTASFDKSIYYWNSTIPAIAAATEKPDIVIHEMLEQYILKSLELSPDIKNDTAFLKKNFPEYSYLNLN
ncbi:MAG: alginate O-acetyltransferase AlgX-related protein [Bacteroidota bacterium]